MSDLNFNRRRSNSHGSAIRCPHGDFPSLAAGHYRATGGRTGAIYVADFEKKTQTKLDRVRVRWAWTTDGTWVAPDNPRWQFASQLRAPVIYKVYVATPLPEVEGDEAPEDDAVTKTFVSAAWIQYAGAFGK